MTLTKTLIFKYFSLSFADLLCHMFCSMADEKKKPILTPETTLKVKQKLYKSWRIMTEEWPKTTEF